MLFRRSVARATIVALFLSLLALSKPIDVNAQEPTTPCTYYWDAHRGAAPIEFQRWFNHLDARGYARYHIACAFGWGAAEFSCLDTLWTEESDWYHLADGPNGPAGNTWGIPQAYPGEKMRVGGPDWKTNPRLQVRWGTDYIDKRYGRPQNTPNHCHAGY